MKYILSILFALFCFRGFAQTIINDKNAQVRNVGSFTGIKVSGGIDVYLSQGDDYALAVSAADDEYRNNIQTEIQNGILVISYKSSGFRLHSNPHLRAYISFKTLQSLEASGACDFIFNGNVKGNSLKIKLSGACDIRGKIDLENMELNVSGASTVRVNGRVTNLKIDASGASDIKNYDLVTDNCIADISGASDVRLTVNQSLKAKASGASTFYYRGNPEKNEIYSSGASTISQKN